jgi:hypothetical protein
MEVGNGNTAHDKEDPTNGLAQKGAEACLIPGRR